MRFTLPAAALLLLAAPAAAQERSASDTDFSWDGRIAPGRWIRVKNMNGAIIITVL